MLPHLMVYIIIRSGTNFRSCKHKSNIFFQFDCSFPIISLPSTFVWWTFACNQKWAIPEKKQTGGGGGVEDILFWKPPLELFIFYFTPGNSLQSKAPPLEIPQNCVRSLENFKAKTKTPKNSTLCFLLHPWKFHFVFNWHCCTFATPP